MVAVVNSFFAMKPFSCSECGRSYGSEASFHLHKRAWECKGEIVVHSAFICHICGKGLKDRMAEMKHLKV